MSNFAWPYELVVGNTNNCYNQYVVYAHTICLIWCPFMKESVMFISITQFRGRSGSSFLAHKQCYKVTATFDGIRVCTI